MNLTLKKCLKMENKIATRIKVVSLKLNKEDKEPKNYIYVENEHGVLLIDKELFTISFFNKEHMLYNDIKILKEGNLNITLLL